MYNVDPDPPPKGADLKRLERSEKRLEQLRNQAQAWATHFSRRKRRLCSVAVPSGAVGCGRVLNKHAVSPASALRKDLAG
jgi:hypothetical protein